MIRYIEKGDIFRIDGVSSYAHGCNCAGAMGKGIAVQFKSKYPDMYLEYKQLCKVHIPEHTRSLSGSLLGYKTIP